MSIAQALAGPWISAVEARRRLGLDAHQFSHAHRGGHLTTKKFPGCRMEVLESDVERLMHGAVRLAKHQDETATS